MSLVVGLRRGEKVFVGEHRFTLVTVTTENDFVLQDDETKVRHQIRASRAVEVRPNVFIAAGERDASMYARLAIDAPRELRISRGDENGQPIQAPPRRQKTGT